MSHVGKSTESGAREMARERELTALVAVREDLSLVSSTHTGQSTTVQLEQNGSVVRGGWEEEKCGR